MICILNIIKFDKPEYERYLFPQVLVAFLVQQRDATGFNSNSAERRLFELASRKNEDRIGTKKNMHNG